MAISQYIGSQHESGAQITDRLSRIERLAEDGWVKVMVKDNGCGMSEEHIRQAFEPFYTTKPPGKGTGLGLAVCYRLVEYHRGRISMTSTVGEGTIVTVSLPVYQPKTQGENSVAAARPDVAGPLGGLDDGQHHPDCR